jgi:hypothetical protein
MSNGHILELATLPTAHPRCGAALLLQCATSTIIRLSVDPTALSPGTMSRAVAVDWLARPGSGTPVQEQRAIGRSGLANGSGAAAVQWRQTIPSQDITEQAAIAVMALLIHDLAQGEIDQVLEIGSGGDYLVLVRDLKRPVQAESSGVRIDANGAESRRRLTKKKEQVLQRCRAGFAAVTTFAHRQGNIVHCYLHYARRKPRKKKHKKAKRR